MGLIPTTAEYIPEDRAAIAAAQIRAELMKAQMSLLQQSRESAVRQNLADTALQAENARADREMQFREKMANAENAFKSGLADRQIQAEMASQDRLRAFELQKLREQHNLAMDTPEQQLAKTQLEGYANLTPEEKRDKLMGINAVERERLVIEKAKAIADAKRSDAEAAHRRTTEDMNRLQLRKQFERGEVTDENVSNLFSKTAEKLRLSPQITDIEDSLETFRVGASQAPSNAWTNHYLDFVNKHITKGRGLTKEVKARQTMLIDELIRNREAKAAANLEEIKQVAALDPATASMLADRALAEAAQLKNIKIKAAVTKFDLNKEPEQGFMSKMWDTGVNAAPYLGGGALAVGGGLWYAKKKGWLDKFFKSTPKVESAKGGKISLKDIFNKAKEAQRAKARIKGGFRGGAAGGMPYVDYDEMMDFLAEQERERQALRGGVM